VVSGRKKSVSRAEEWLRGEGATCTALRVEGAFHTPLMESIAGEFALEISRCDFAPARGRVISSITGEPYSDPEGMGPALALQLSRPVLWTGALARIRSEGCRAGCETGPGRTLRNLAAKEDIGFGILALDDPEDAAGLRSLGERAAGDADPLSGAAPGSELAFIRSCLGVVAATPNREWNADSHRTGVLIPVSRLRALERLAAEGRGRTGIRAEALSLVTGILRAKGVASGEIEARMSAIAAGADR
jgi:[acyl-carrier-protein] S-malonyltransferase